MVLVAVLAACCAVAIVAIMHRKDGGVLDDVRIDHGGGMVYGHASPEELKCIARANGGKVTFVRLDRETREWVEETITADMPDEEIIL
jgi:hypothetical protein